MLIVTDVLYELIDMYNPAYYAAGQILNELVTNFKPKVAIIWKKRVRKDNKIVDQKVSYIWVIQLHFLGHNILYNNHEKLAQSSH